MIETSLTKENIVEISSRTLGSYAETDPSSIKLSDFITILPTDNCGLRGMENNYSNHNFVDIDYIINLVHDLDYEGLLYLRNVVDELIKK